MKLTIAILLSAVSVEAIKKRHHQESSYEPGWGHNSGDSYNNGPTTHFYYGKASPYSVVKEDVQVDE
jgi:hypothetical protein